jgi:hypothetical protein
MLQPRLSAVQKQILRLLAEAGEAGLSHWDIKGRLYDVRESYLQRQILNLEDHGLVRVRDWVRGDLERRQMRVVLTAEGEALAGGRVAPNPA